MVGLKKALKELAKFIMDLCRAIGRLLKALWQKVLKPLAQTIRSLPWGKWAAGVKDFINRTPHAKPLLCAVLVCIVAVAVLSGLLGRGRNDTPAADVSPATEEAGAVPETSPAAFSEAAEAQPEEDKSAAEEEGAAPAPDGPEGETLTAQAEGSDTENATGTEGDPTQSQLYQESYDDMMEHMDEVIAVYWQNGGDSLVTALEGTFEEFYDAVNQLDPNFFDSVSESMAYKYAEGPLEAHLIKTGVDTYFSDDEIGQGLRSISERFFLGLLDRSFSKDDAVRKDMMRFCAGNMEYALARTAGSIRGILGQISKDSGYYTAVTAIDDCYEQIDAYYTSNITAEMSIVMNGGEEAEEIGEKWDILQGRMDALQDKRAEWDSKLDEWTGDFLSDLHPDPGILDQYIYAVVDKDGEICGTYIAPGSVGDLMITSSGICSWQDDTGFHVVNKDGSELYHFETKDGYYDPSPSGNLLHETSTDDFDLGVYETLAIERPDGTAQEIVTGYGITAAPVNTVNHYYGYKGSRVYQNWTWGTNTRTDIWRVDYRPLDQEGTKTIVVDVASGEIYEPDAYLSEHPASDWRRGHYDTEITEDYMLDTGTWELYEKDDPEKVVADFSAGQGLERLFYDEIHQQYWAVTRTGYYYVTDKDFNRIHEPVKLEHGWWDVSPYGMICNTTVVDQQTGESSTVRGLFDAEGNLLCTIPGNEIMGFAANIYKDDAWFRIDRNGFFHMATQEQLYLKFS